MARNLDAIARRQTRWAALLGVLGAVAPGCGGATVAPESFESGPETGADTAGDTAGDTHGASGDGDSDGDACFGPLDEPHIDPLQHLARGAGGFSIEVLDMAHVVTPGGPVVVACTGTQGMWGWDLSDPEEPAGLFNNVGGPITHTMFPRCQNVAVNAAGDRAVITNRGDELQPRPWIQLLDLSDPDEPVPLADWDEEFWPLEGALFDGDALYVGAHQNGIFRFEREGENLVLTGRFADAQSDAGRLVWVGDRLWVAEGNTGLRVYDVSEPRAPRPLATLALGGPARDLVVRGDRVYAVASTELVVLDASNPDEPVVLGRRRTLGTALALAPGRDGTVFVAEWDEIRGYDASDPSDIRHVLSEVVPDSGGAFSRVLSVETDPDRDLVFAGEWNVMHTYRHVPGGRGPDVMASPQALQFGTVAPGQTRDRVLVVRNLGDRPLRVADTGSTHPDVSLIEACFEIPAGDSMALEVLFSPSSTEEARGLVGLLTDDPDENVFSVRFGGNVEGVGIGDPAPDFELEDLDGTLHRSADLRGNVVLLAYFATF